MSSGFILVVARVRLSFLVRVEQYSAVRIGYSLRTHSSAGGHLGCFPLWTVVSHGAVSTEVHVSFKVPALSSFGYIPRGNCWVI